MTNVIKTNPTRRTFIKSSLALSAGGAVLAACGNGATSSLQCATSDTLSRSEMLSREGRDYAEVSRVDGRNCLNCEFYNGFEAECGSCQIDNLPANPAGHCVSWTEKQA
jgi:hypothetical protein